jgi:hypothetical protein
MANLEFLTKYSCLSDSNRWDVTKFKYDTSKLSMADKLLLSNLVKIGEGELTGTTTGLLFIKLSHDVDVDLQPDFFNAVIYLNIIIMEEFRHGLVIGALNDSKYVENFNLDEFAAESLATVNKHQTWNIYSLLMSLCLSECTNIQLYKSVVNKAESQLLKTIFSNIVKDEARHLSAWRDMIKILVECNPKHHQMFLNTIGEASNKHNASIGTGYQEGMKATLKIFESDSIDKIVESKWHTLSYIFGKSFTQSKQHIKAQHIRNIASSMRNK